MRKIIWLTLLCLICANVFGTQYYFSNAGITTNTGTSPASPWPVSRLNFAFLPDDQVLFNKGETFFISINVGRSGTAGHPIIYSSYGTGAMPIITGFATVSSFTNLGANIWESTTAVSSLSQCNMVLISGANIPQGRTPQTGYFTITAATGATSLSSTSLNAAITNWTGAEAVIRKVAWVTDRNVISSAATNSITFPASSDGFPSQVGWGFFIQNDVRTLTYQNAWYYNPSTNKIRIFSTSNPGSIQVSAIDTLLKLSNRHDVTFDGIKFTGSNKITMQIASQNVTVQNCVLDYAGTDCIWGGQNLATSSGCIIQNNYIDHVNNNAILLRSFFTGATIQNNIIRNIGLQEGMLNRVSNSNQFGMGIEMRSDNAMIQNNQIFNCGYANIEMFGNSITVQNNYCNGATMTLADGGNIYTFVGFAPDNITPLTPYTGMIIRNNICLNSVGYGAGTGNTGLPQGQGIYLDDCTQNVDLGGNSISGSANSGIYLHNTQNINVHNNTYFDCGNGIVWDCGKDLARIRTITYKKNISVAKTATENVSNPRSNFDQVDIQTFGTAANIDSNVQARPIDDNLDFLIKSGGAFSNFNLGQWRTFSGFDLHSTKSPVAITNVNQLFYAYNQATHDSTITLTGNYIDMFNVAYNTGSVVLHPSTSIVLINTGTNIAPTADAGTNKNITLPTSSVTQVGGGTDPDGVIVSYQWTTFSAPTAITFGTPNSSTTTVNGMSVAGTYVVMLTVIDNQGLAGTDTATIIVNSSPPVNIPPTANAGTNKTIVLPTSSVTQVGSGTDVDGTIAAYLWTQVSGPATISFGSATSATTTVNGMTVAGTYGIQLKVTDNLGATGTATATIIVNVAANILPVAHAGTDQVLTWPVNTVSLTGSGTDSDGSIVAYNWTKISGGVGTITSSTSASTTVTGLDLGVYQFQLQVIDNNGGTALDTVQVTVNKGAATLSASATTVTFNGTAQQPLITTNPAGIAFSQTLNGVTGGQINAGAYPYAAGITDPHWTFTPISGTFTINKQTIVINAVGKTVNFDGNPQTITATTTPSVPGLVLTYTYNGSGTAPSALGTYDVAISLTDANRQATTVHVTLNIVTNPEIIFISDTTKTYNGSMQPVTVTSAFTFTTFYTGILGTSYATSATPPTNSGFYQVISTITQVGHVGADTATETISQQTPVLMSLQPASLPYGTLFSPALLSPTSNVAGTFTFDFPTGSQLPLGITVITATFHPTDSVNYSSHTVEAILTVFPVNPFLNILISGPGGKFWFIKE